jgi:hypothetical protein
MFSDMARLPKGDPVVSRPDPPFVPFQEDVGT